LETFPKSSAAGLRSSGKYSAVPFSADGGKQNIQKLKKDVLFLRIKYPQKAA